MVILGSSDTGAIKYLSSLGRFLKNKVWVFENKKKLLKKTIQLLSLKKNIQFLSLKKAKKQPDFHFVINI